MRELKTSFVINFIDLPEERLFEWQSAMRLAIHLIEGKKLTDGPTDINSGTTPSSKNLEDANFEESGLASMTEEDIKRLEELANWAAPKTS